MISLPLTPAEQAAAEALARHFNRHYSEGERHKAFDWEGEARAVVAAVQPAIEEPYARAVAALATALDNLGGRVYRDLAGDYAEIHNGDAHGTVAGFNAYAEDCLAVLNDPDVRAVVDAALSRPTSGENRNA